MTIGRQKLQGRQAAEAGLLLARPKQPTEAAPRGLQPLGLSAKRDGLLYVPPTYQVKQPAPLVVMLHGAGGDARGGLKLLKPFADAAGLILLAPASRQKTWDVLYGQYGPDIAFIDQALEQTFSRCAIDPAHIAVGGFSDGASYALSVGITNGDLFTHVIAFSPGFMAPAQQQGKPRLFISHGESGAEGGSPSVGNRRTRRAREIRFYQSTDVAASSCRSLLVLATTCFIGSSTVPTRSLQRSRALH